MITIADLKPGQFAYLVDKGFDHGTFRAYFIQRDSERSVETLHGRGCIPVKIHEITHFRKDTSRKDEPFKEIVLHAKGEEPRKALLDGRYGVEP